MNENEQPTPINGHAIIPPAGETERSKAIRERQDAAPVEASEAEASQPPASETPQVQRVRWSLFKVDGDWPPAGVVTVDVELPKPAVFSRAYAVRTGLAGLDGKPQAKLRLVFVVCPDAPVMPVRMLIMDHVSAIAVEAGKPMPEYLDTVIHPTTGEPVGIWRVPAAGDPVDQDAEECASPDA